jgi:hypothetical protein
LFPATTPLLPCADLTLYPPQKWKEKGWDFIDSMDPQREWDGWAYADIPDPQRGEEGYPRLQIENRIYCRWAAVLALPGCCQLSAAGRWLLADACWPPVVVWTGLLCLCWLPGVGGSIAAAGQPGSGR